MTKYEVVGLRKLVGPAYAQLWESLRVYGKGLLPKDYKPKK